MWHFPIYSVSTSYLRSIMKSRSPELSAIFASQFCFYHQLKHWKQKLKQYLSVYVSTVWTEHGTVCVFTPPPPTQKGSVRKIYIISQFELTNNSIDLFCRFIFIFSRF